MIDTVCPPRPRRSPIWKGVLMATTEQAATSQSSLQELARRHLWLHFARLGGYDEAHEIPVIARGEGVYVYDEHGKRYFDGLSALFCVNIGHGRADVAQAGADQARELGFYTHWTSPHPRAIDPGAPPGARGAAPRPSQAGGLPQAPLAPRAWMGGGRPRELPRPPVPQADR